MSKVEELRKKRAKLIATAQAKVAEYDEKRGQIGAEMSAEQSQEIDRILSEAEEARAAAENLTREIETRAGIEAAAEAAARGRGAPGVPAGAGEAVDAGAVDYRGAFEQYIAAGGHLEGVPAEVRGALIDGAVTADGVPLGQVEMRAGVRLGVDAAGGFLVPQEEMGPLDVAMRLYGPMLSMEPGLFQIFKTAGVAALPVPTVNDTANEGAEEAAEGDVYGAGDDFVFGSVSLGGRLIKCPWVPVSLQFLLSAPAGIGDVLAGLVAERIGAAGNRLLTTGACGIVTGASLGKTSGAVGSFTVDELHAFVRDFKEGHRQDPSFRLMMSGATKTALVTERNADGTFILTGEDDGVLRLGQTRVKTMVNEYMPAVATGQAPFVAGVMRKYAVRHGNNGRVSIAVSTGPNSQFAPSAGIAGHRFVDGAVTDATAIKKFVMQ